MRVVPTVCMLASLFLLTACPSAGLQPGSNWNQLLSSMPNQTQSHQTSTTHESSQTSTNTLSNTTQRDTPNGGSIMRAASHTSTTTNSSSTTHTKTTSISG